MLGLNTGVTYSAPYENNLPLFVSSNLECRVTVYEGVTVNVTGTNSRGYGFQMASQVGNDNAGNFSLGTLSEDAELNGNRVQHSSRTVSGEWIIDWLAPSSDVGDITFSVSGLALSLIHI